MSTILNTNGDSVEVPHLHNLVKGNFYILTAQWNPDVTEALRDGANDVLRYAGIDSSRIRHLSVPGSVELVNAAAQVLNPENRAQVAAVIIIGCVIRGDTPHFDYVCDIVAKGVADLNSRGEAPVIFGVLTVENLQQALDRAGGKLGNKGAEAASAAITMANFKYLI